MALSKSELLNGKNNIISFQPTGFDDILYLRPLTIGEVNSLEELKNKALGTYVANETAKHHSSKKRIKGELTAQAKLNLEKTTIADNKANVQAVMWSLDNDSNDFTLNEEEVKKLNPQVFEELLMKVKEISHWDDEELESDVEDFHQD